MQEGNTKCNFFLRSREFSGCSSGSRPAKRHLRSPKSDKTDAAIVLHLVVTPDHAGHANHFELQEMLVRETPPLPSLRLGRPNLPLEVGLFARQPLGLTLAHDLLAEPFCLEALLELLEVVDDILATLDDRIAGRDGAIGGDTELEGREERMWDFVGGEYDVVVLEEALGKEVA
jgi:hypothetical protein